MGETLMATFVNDTFTDTNAVALASHTGEAGATWAKNTIYTGVFTIQANRIYGSSGAAGLYYASGTPASPNYEVAATVRIVSAVTSRIGVAGRLVTNADTMYQFYLELVTATWSLHLARGVAGSYVELGNTAPATPTVGSDHTLKLRMVGNQISGYYDGVRVLGPFTDTSITAANRAGVYYQVAVTTTTGSHIDTVTATDVATRGTSINSAPLVRASLY